MTTASIMGGLPPLAELPFTGGEVLKRIAAPMVGGMVSSTILTVLLIPALCFVWRRSRLVLNS